MLSNNLGKALLPLLFTTALSIEGKLCQHNIASLEKNLFNFKKKLIDAQTKELCIVSC